MVNPRKIPLMAFLLIGLMLMSQPIRAQDSLDQHFVSADGTLKFKYPSGWVAQDVYGAVTLANSPQTFGDDAFSVTPGSIFGVLFVLRFEEVLPPNTEPSIYNALHHFITEASVGEDGYQFGDVVESPVAGHPAIHCRGWKDDQHTLILVIDLGDGYFAEFSAVTAPGELESFQATVLAILETIEFSPPPPPVIAGELVWQTTGAFEDADGPQDSLTSIAVGPDDSVYTSDSASIFVYDAAGTLQNIIQNAAVMGIQDLAIDADGTIWLVSNTLHQIIQLDAEGEILQAWGTRGQDVGEFGFLSPLQIELGLDGNIYVLDNNEDAAGLAFGQVQVWTPQGEFLRQFPITPPATDPTATLGMISTVTARLAFGPNGNLYVLDATTLRIFDTQGAVITENIAALRLSDIRNTGNSLAIGPDGEIYIGTGAGPILEQDASGNYIQQFGTPQTNIDTDENGFDPPFSPGEFFKPQAIAVLSNGDLVVADSNFDYWQVARFTFKG